MIYLRHDSLEYHQKYSACLVMRTESTPLSDAVYHRLTDDNSGPMDRVLTSPANGEHWMVYEVIDHRRNNENLKDTGIKSSK